MMQDVIQPLHGVPKRAAKACWKRWHCLSSGFLISRVMRQSSKKPGKIIRVGFIARGGLSEKGIGVYQEMQSRKEFETVILVSPVRNRITKQDGKDHFPYEKYQDAIPAASLGTDVKKWNLDYVIFFEQYPRLYSKILRASCLARSVRCCYIPYGCSGSRKIDRENAQNPFFEYMHLFFASSQAELKEHVRGRKKGRDRLRKKVFLGYPYLEHILKQQKEQSERTVQGDFVPKVTWTPRWTSSHEIGAGGSNFLRYKDDFLALARCSRTIQFGFRPHPMMFDELILRGDMKERDKKGYLKALEDAGVYIDLDSPVEAVFQNTDVLLSDYSSILLPFTAMGKPVIYCDAGVVLNSEMEAVSSHFFVADNWEEVQKCMQKLSGREFYNQTCQEIRMFANQHFAVHKGASKRITDYILCDYRRNIRNE